MKSFLAKKKMNDLTTKQVGAILGISLGMVCRLYRQAKLTGYKINPSCLMIKQDDKFIKMVRYYLHLKTLEIIK